MPNKSWVETPRDTRLTTAVKTAWLAAGSSLSPDTRECVKLVATGNSASGGMREG